MEEKAGENGKEAEGLLSMLDRHSFFLFFFFFFG